MHFSPAVQALAERIIASMTARGGSEYNAVHLRIEKDARDWSTIMGGEAVSTRAPETQPPDCGRPTS